MELSFTKNGKWMGIAFRIQKEALGGQALYPHVLVKNCAVEFNFGQRAEPYCSVLPGFTFIQHLPLSERIRGTVGPKSKAECEVRGLEACLGGRPCRATLLPRQETCPQLSVAELPSFGESEGVWAWLRPKRAGLS